MTATPYILIVAPFPGAHNVAEGWMSRIRVVDHLFATRNRVYVNFGTHHRVGPDDAPVVYSAAPDIRQYNLNQDEPAHQAIFEKLLAGSDFCYCHTVHLAKNVRQWLPSGKIITDIHGIVPEEEIMMGRPDQAEVYAPVEAEVLRHSRRLVCVTEAMRRHLLVKYPECTAEFTILPIYEDYGHLRSTRENDALQDNRPGILYSGATQAWQNLDLMLTLVGELHEVADFHFLSHDQAIIRSKAAERGLRDYASYGVAKKTDLPDIYARYPFGLVLRDDTAVNTVSCPTKLSEYLDFGIIPIVKHPSLGDFLEDGYVYVTLDEVRAGYLPDAATRQHMRQTNYRAIARLRDRFHRGAATLAQIKL